MRDGNIRVKREGEPGWIASLLGAGVLIAGGFALGLVAGVVSEEPELVVGHLVGRSEEVAWAPDAEPELTPTGEQIAMFNADAPDAAEHLAEGSERVEPERILEARRLPEVAAVRADPEPELPAVATAPPKRRERRQVQEIQSLPEVVESPQPEVVESPQPQRVEPTVERRLVQEPAPTASVIQGGYAVQVGAFGDGGSADKMRNKLIGRGFDSYVISAAESGDGKWRVRVGPVETKGAAERLASRLKTEERLPTWVLAVGGG